MPTSSDELRQKMKEFYGDPIDDAAPLGHLIACGWMVKGGLLVPPQKLEEVPEKEFLSALFLHDEWDYAIYSPQS